MEDKTWKHWLEERWVDTPRINKETKIVDTDTIGLCLNVGIKDDKPFCYLAVEVFTKTSRIGPHEFSEIKDVHLTKKFETLSEATECYNNLKIEDICR